MQRFLLRTESRAPNFEDATRRCARTLCDEGRSLLCGALCESALPPGESTLRTAYRLIAALANLAAWSAPAAQESCAINSFTQAVARDVVAYARYGCAETTAQESAHAAMLGVDAGRCRLLLTSSGMAAYALIESFLLRDVLHHGDRVVLHPGVYFETQAQLRSLPFVDVHTAGAERSDLLEAIAVHRPTVVFVDPLTNTADLRCLDLPSLLAAADALCTRETWFVIDGTLMSGAFDPFAGAPRRHVRVLYYESGCKYLQFGMDLGPAGVLLVERHLAARFEHLRRGLGVIAPEGLVLPRASRPVYLTFLRAQTASVEAAAAAALRAQRGRRPAIIEPVFPGLINHPDYKQAQNYSHRGGVMTFRFGDARLNRRAPLEAFIDFLIDAARAQRLPLTAGVSFGFRTPRIAAAWSSFDEDAAFLRLSAGVRPERAAKIGELIAKCAAEFMLEPACCN